MEKGYVKIPLDEYDCLKETYNKWHNEMESRSEEFGRLSKKYKEELKAIAKKEGAVFIGFNKANYGQWITYQYMTNESIIKKYHKYIIYYRRLPNIIKMLFKLNI